MACDASAGVSISKMVIVKIRICVYLSEIDRPLSKPTCWVHRWSNRCLDRRLSCHLRSLCRDLFLLWRWHGCYSGLGRLLVGIL